MIVSTGGIRTAAHLAAGVLLALVMVSARAADDHGNDAVSATFITVGVSVSGDIETGTDDDYFSFWAIAGTVYTLETTSGTLSDTVLYLYDTDGTLELDSNDDGGVGAASLINWVCPATGFYYARVLSWGSGTGTYSLLVSDDDPYEENDTLATAWDFSFGELAWLSSYGGSLGVANDFDWYMISVTAGFENVIIDCTFTHALGDIDIRLVNSAGTIVASSSSITDNESIDFVVSGPGTYLYCTTSQSQRILFGAKRLRDFQW